MKNVTMVKRTGRGRKKVGSNRKFRLEHKAEQPGTFLREQNVFIACLHEIISVH